MSNVLLRTEKDALSLYASNDILTVTMRIAAEVEQSGSVLLHGRRVAGICCELAGETLTIESPAEGGRITLSSAPSRFILNSIPPADYPVHPHVVDKGDTLRVKQSALAGALEEVAKAMGRDASRPLLQGVYFEWEGETLTLVATDGRRLTLSTMVVPTSGKASFIVPDRAVVFLQSVIGKGAEVAISADARSAVFVIDSCPTGTLTGPVTVTLRLIEGNFPAYRHVIPKDMPVTAVVRREEILAALQRAALVCSPKHSSVILNVTADGVRITVRNPDLGESDETVPLVSVSGGDVTGCFNPAFLIDSLSSLTFDEACLRFRNSTSPLKIEVGDRYTGVIMPLRLQ